MRRIRWTRYAAALIFLAFLWNLQVIYNFLEPKKPGLHSKPADVEAVKFDSSELIPGGDDENYDREPLVANITSTLALDAIRRAKITSCKRQLIETEYRRENDPESITPKHLPRFCPMADNSKYGQYVGCYADHPDNRLLKYGQFELKDSNSIDNCLYHCVRVGQELAGVQYGSECFCGTKSALKKTVPLTSGGGLCEAYKCPGNESQFCGGYKVMAVYETGVGRRAPVNVKKIKPDETVEGPPAKIVFLLQLNGRSSRQVRRLLKLLYRRKHFYYVHVDSRQPYMYREMLDVERLLPNVKVKSKRFSSIWGGASLLTAIMDSFKDILDELRFWPWEYVVNLSEADMPLVSVDTVERFLRKYRGSNFMRSAGNNTASFIKKQGLDQVFSECEHRMFRLGKRDLPDGIRFDGGSDWFVLHRAFVEYAIHGPTDQQEKVLVDGMKRMFETALLPAESFFHTLAINSHFCTTVADTNLKLTNWRRKQGCKCQYKHIVDWCGCSPNVLMTDDFHRLKQPDVMDRVDYFARKFDAMIDQSVIRLVEAQIYDQEASMPGMVAAAAAADAAPVPTPEGKERLPSTSSALTTSKSVDRDEFPGFHAYWESMYDVIDEPMNELRSTDYPLWLLLRSLSRQVVNYTLSQIPDDDKPQCGRRCGNVDTIQQLHAYQETDIFGGLLVRLNGTCLGTGERQPWSLEAYVKRIQNMTKNMDAGSLATALLTLEVGTKFDVKEEIFRNYAGAMTVDKSIALRHHWDKALLDEVPKDKRRVNIIFLDPDGDQRGAYVQRLENPTGFEYTKLPITKSHQLESGIWTVQLRSHSNVLIAQTTFPLLPASNGHQSEDATLVDKLIRPFYNVQYACRASPLDWDTTKPPTDQCEKHFLLTMDEVKDGRYNRRDAEPGKGLPVCRHTYWSSLSPDPKSEIEGFDWKNGYILPR